MISAPYHQLPSRHIPPPAPTDNTRNLHAIHPRLELATAMQPDLWALDKQLPLVGELCLSWQLHLDEAGVGFIGFVGCVGWVGLVPLDSDLYAVVEKGVELLATEGAGELTEAGKIDRWGRAGDRRAAGLAGDEVGN